MKNIIGLGKKQLEQELVALGEKPFRAAQIWNWIYVRGVQNFAEMTNIAKETREKLTQNFSLARSTTSKDLTALDGTRKWLVKFADGNCVEMVFIPEETRGTLCISSQVGCTLACKFCHTGTQTLVRNLEAREIVEQIMIAKDCLGDWDITGKNSCNYPSEAQKNAEIKNASSAQKTLEEKSFTSSNSAEKSTAENYDDEENSAQNLSPKKLCRRITNVVFMGMGEPFYNYENVAQTVSVLNDSAGLNISARRITISTSGLVPEILRMSKELKTALAISLHATNDATRTSIMAINKKYPLDELMKACKIYNNENPAQKITFEYVLLSGINDSAKCAQELIGLVKKYNLNAKINLIPFNPWMPCGFTRSSDEVILKFQQVLKNGKLVAPIRKTRGDDVMAACGQLKSDSMRIRKADLKNLSINKKPS